MSVPASQRYVSAMQYIETARRLARSVLAYSCRVPKRYWQRLANPLCNWSVPDLGRTFPDPYRASGRPAATGNA